MRIKGISRQLVEAMTERTNALGQGRNCGCIAFVDETGVISKAAEITDGGLGGVPLRQLINKVVPVKHKSMLEALGALPTNSVFVFTQPGQTGLITDVNGIDIFGSPIIHLGIKGGEFIGAGIIYPEDRFFELATESEIMTLRVLEARTMAEEKEVLRRLNELETAYLDICHELPLVDREITWQRGQQLAGPAHTLRRWPVKTIDRGLVDELVQASIAVEQGREVATIGLVDADGRVTGKGKIVYGGMGYVPSRLLASSYTDIRGESLKEVYLTEIPENAVIVHTHPGGTGVMHMGDASAGPVTWGRPIIAIGHDKDGTVKGATVLQADDRVIELVDEYEMVNQAFFRAATVEEESRIRNERFKIAQAYTDLCVPIEIK